MARRTISFNGTSLQDGSIYITQDIEHESVDQREVNIQRFGNRDGGKIVNVLFPPRIIRITGIIKGTSIDNLETNVDAFKALMSNQEKNLDIQYASGTRRYKCTATSYKIARSHYNMTFVPFEVTFVASNPPFGGALDSATASFTGLGTSFGTYQGTFTTLGNYKPMPTIKMTVNGQSGMSKVAFTNRTTGSTITVERVFSNGEVLIIDTDAYTVTVNGTAVDYTGFFPDFVVGNNDFKRVIWSTWHSVDLKLIYRPLWL